MSTETVGDLGVHDTKAQAESALVSPGFVHFLLTTFDGEAYRNIYLDTQFTVPGKDITYVGIDDVFFETDGDLVRLTTSSDVLTYINIKGRSTLANAVEFAGGDMTVVVRGCNLVGGNRALFFLNNINNDVDITVEGCVFESLASFGGRVDGSLGTNSTLRIRNNLFVAHTSTAFSSVGSSLGAGTVFNLDNNIGFSKLGTNWAVTAGGRTTERTNAAPDADAQVLVAVADMDMFDITGRQSKWGLINPNIYDATSSLLDVGTDLSLTATDINGTTATTSDSWPIGPSFRTQASTPGSPDNPSLLKSGNFYCVTVDSINANERLQIEATVSATPNFLHAENLTGQTGQGGHVYVNDTDIKTTRTNENGSTTFAFELAGATDIKVALVNQYNKAGTSTSLTAQTIPSSDDVRSGVSVGTGTGNMTLPAATDVETGIQYGTDGTEFTGDVVLPIESDVREDTTYGSPGEFTGTFSATAINNLSPAISVAPSKPFSIAVK